MEGRKLVTVRDYEEAAKASLDKGVYDYFAGGANDEVTLKRYRKAFEKCLLVPHVLNGNAVHMDTTVLGTTVSSPVLVAPSALHCLAHEEGEKATARAVGRCGSLMCLSSLASTTMEDVAHAAPSTPRWFQLSSVREDVMNVLISRAEKAGYTALVFTVDAPVLGLFHEFCEREKSNPPSASAKEMSQMARFIHSLGKDNRWDFISRVKKVSRLPIVLKGILHPLAAAEAVKRGVDAIVVSNHGGRQLDTAITAFEALRGVVSAVRNTEGGDGVEVYLDGGISRGTDVVKALALGARAVFVGRPVLWGLAAGGEEGVVNVLNILNSETRTAIALTGQMDVTRVSSDIIHEPSKL